MTLIILLTYLMSKIILMNMRFSLSHLEKPSRVLLNFLYRHKKSGISLAVFFLFFFFYEIFSPPSSTDSFSKPLFQKVKIDTLFTDLVLSGELHSSEAISLKSPMEWQYSLQIVYLIPEGRHVSKGDTLLKFDTAKLQVVLIDKKRDLQKKLADLHELKLNQKLKMTQLRDQLKLATYNLEEARLRVENSRFESDVSKKQTDIQLKQAQIQMEQARQAIKNEAIIQKANLMQMNLQVANTKSEIKDIRNRIGRFILLAPAPGMVVYGESWSGSTSRKIRLGDKVHPGQELIRIPNLDFIESIVYVNEVDIQRVKLGQRAQLWLEAHPHRIYHGIVTDISKISQPENFVHGQIWDQPSTIHVFPAHIKIVNPDSSLKPGMTIKTRVLLDTIPNAVLIPTTAVGEIDGKPFVFTKRGKRAVQLGKRNECDVIVLKGLSKNDFVQDPPPFDQMEPLGYLAFYKANFAKTDSLSRQIDRMQKRGFTYDYNANRGKNPEPALHSKKMKKAGLLPPQIRQMLGSKSDKKTPTGKKKSLTKQKVQKEHE